MIPVCEPLITEEDISMALECLRSGWISSSGSFIDDFEAKWAQYCNMPYGIAVSNGTVALQLAVRLLNLQEGDEVIMPTFTIISCAQALIYNGLKPVLVDMHPLNWQMDVTQIEQKITEKTKAIMIVHIYGHPADMDGILEIANRHNLLVLEDAAEAHGAEYKGKKCGSLADVSTFSFYANKLITTGEGGMVLVRDEALAERAKGLRNLCFHKGRRFLHEDLGYNFRLTNLQASIALKQIERISEIIQRKRSIAKRYNELLQGLPLQLPVEEEWAKSVYWVYGIVVEESTGLTADDVMYRLKQRGIETRPFFLGMHMQPCFKKLAMFEGECYPVAERLSRQGLYLPNGLGIKDEEIKYICA
ncbi:MAG: DegT/DnrJ/EryC1/StrS family aminotransferase [Thermodesulfovibrionales bacterium]